MPTGASLTKEMIVSSMVRQLIACMHSEAQKKSCLLQAERFHSGNVSALAFPCRTCIFSCAASYSNCLKSATPAIWC